MSATLRIAVIGVVLGALPLAGQDSTDQKCKDFNTAHNVKSGTPAPSPCVQTADYVAREAKIVSNARDHALQSDVSVASVFSPRDLQRQGSQQPSLAGSVAQGQAVPGAQPTGVAAGSVAVVGTTAGNNAIAALGVNPAILFIADTVSRALATASRLTDITFFVPASSATTTSSSATATPPSSTNQPDGKLKYFGARFRLNILALSTGDAVWQDADASVRQLIVDDAKRSVRIQAALKKAPDFVGCADTLLASTNLANIKAACAADSLLTVDPQQAERVRQQFAALRGRADDAYLGLDIRLDFGDPSLGSVPNASGTSIFAGAAGGRRFATSSGTTVGLRGWGGALYTRVDSLQAAVFSIDGGAGFEIARTVSDQEFNASAGLEFRSGSPPAGTASTFQTNLGVFRASIEVPIIAGNSISINLGVPAWGPASSPTLSVNFNWGLLLPGGKPGS